MTPFTPRELQAMEAAPAECSTPCDCMDPHHVGPVHPRRDSSAEEILCKGCKLPITPGDLRRGDNWHAHCFQIVAMEAPRTPKARKIRGMTATQSIILLAAAAEGQAQMAGERAHWVGGVRPAAVPVTTAGAAARQ